MLGVVTPTGTAALLSIAGVAAITASVMHLPSANRRFVLGDDADDSIRDYENEIIGFENQLAARQAQSNEEDIEELRRAIQDSTLAMKLTIKDALNTCKVDLKPLWDVFQELSDKHGETTFTLDEIQTKQDEINAELSNRMNDLETRQLGMVGVIQRTEGEQVKQGEQLEKLEATQDELAATMKIMEDKISTIQEKENDVNMEKNLKGAETDCKNALIAVNEWRQAAKEQAECLNKDLRKANEHFNQMLLSASQPVQQFFSLKK